MASGLVMVDVAPRLEQKGIERIAEFMLGNLDGFASLEEVADAVAAYNPHRPRPTDLSGLRKNVRLRDDGRWYWHWDPAFLLGGRQDEPRSVRNEDRLEDAARALTVPTLLVRGRQSDVLSEEGARHMLELIPHARLRRRRRGRPHGGRRPQRRLQRRGDRVPARGAPGLAPHTVFVAVMRTKVRRTAEKRGEGAGQPMRSSEW